MIGFLLLFFYYIYFLIFFFFFFQAEDGIRDGTVTGVQTCALPILVELRAGRVAADFHFERASSLRVVAIDGDGAGRTGAAGLDRCAAVGDVARSEERRVGKECRFGWSGGREKKEGW